MRDVALFRTISFRLAATYAVLFAVSVAVIMGAAYAIATSEIRDISEREIGHDMAAFRSAFAKGGGEELRLRIHERSEGAPGDSFFLLLDGEGRFLGGNVPPELWREGWSERRMDDAMVRQSQELMDSASMNSDGEVRLFSYGETLGPFRVLAGRNSHILHETQEILLGCLLLGCLAIAVVALVGSYLVTRDPARRINAIAGLTRQVVAGRFDMRLPLSRRRDEIDQLSADVNLMLARIETLMESLRQVSTDIAHDLRTPIARLRQRLDLLGRHPPDAGAAFGGAIDEAIAEADTIIETFNALLRIAQVESGARRARFQRLDLAHLTERVCDIYRDVAIDAGHRLETELEAGGALIEGDADLLTQLLVNLVENAINHVPAPGLIEVRVAREGQTVCLSVADDGPGVPPDERGRIFRRLYRLDRSRSTPGTGLGLALVAAITELHGARVAALDNAPGLRIAITFSLARPDKGAPA
ncbi:ATP-binding protein [Aureimonas ureilytica]|uniref:sensor histidine kinase n=1 Tax=Aureimonas ureilytica TaxID=401562 RepID=UPI003CFA722B